MNKTEQLAAYDNAIAFFEKELTDAIKRGDAHCASFAETLRDLTQTKRDAFLAGEQP